MKKYFWLKISSIVLLIIAIILWYLYYKISEQGFHYMNETPDLIY